MKTVQPLLVDGHAHMCDPVFDHDREDVLARARDTGLAAIVSVGENLSDAHKNLALAKRFPMIKVAAGLYPTVLERDQAEEMYAFIRKNQATLVAIGEVGLDYWVIKTDAQKEIQREIFGRFVELSQEVDLPLNVHSRSAGRHAISLLLEKSAHKVQMHAFDGKASAALPAIEAGFYFSIPPSIDRSRQKQKLVKQLPLSCLMVETDSPVLGPVPGVRNEPANLSVSIEAISKIKDLPREAVIEAVIDNTLSLYGKDRFRARGSN